MPAFGQTAFGQILVFCCFGQIFCCCSCHCFCCFCCCCCSWLVPVGGACCWCLLVVPVGGCCLCVCGGCVQDFGASPPDPPPPDRPSPAPPKISLFFFSLPPEISFFLLSLGVFSLNSGGVFEDRDAQMCTFGLSGCRVEPRRPQTGPPGLAHDSPRTPNAHI